MTDTADLVKELDGLNAELRLPVGNATDEELRDLGMKILARFNDGWPTIKAELSRLSARVAELEAEFDGADWVYFSPDAGTEYAEAHPVESGETPDATDIRKATG